MYVFMKCIADWQENPDTPDLSVKMDTRMYYPSFVYEEVVTLYHCYQITFIYLPFISLKPVYTPKAHIKG